MKRPWTMDCKPSTNQSSWVWLLVLTFGGAITKSALGLVVKWAPWFHGLFIFAVSALVLHQALKNFGKVFLCVFGTVFAETHQRVSGLLSFKERCAESCNACGNCRGPTGRKFAAVMNWFANFRTSWQHCPSSGPWAFGEGPSAPSRIVLNERSQGEGKNIYWLQPCPHTYSGREKQVVTRRKRGLIETQLATMGDGVTNERMHEQVVTLFAVEPKL